MQALLTLFLNQLRQVTRQDFYRVGRWFLMVNGVIAIAAFVYINQPYRLIYNNTYSMAKGFWLHDTRAVGNYREGDVVLARYVAPDWIVSRGWADPLHDSLVKRVLAVPGDRLRVQDGHIQNCGRAGGSCLLIAVRLATDGAGKLMRYVPLPDVVPPGHYFLRGDNPRSLDSRYLGLFQTHAILGELDALWVRRIPARLKELTGQQKWATAADEKALPVGAPLPERALPDLPAARVRG